MGRGGGVVDEQLGGDQEGGPQGEVHREGLRHLGRGARRAAAQGVPRAPQQRGGEDFPGEDPGEQDGCPGGGYPVRGDGFPDEGVVVRRPGEGFGEDPEGLEGVGEVAEGDEGQPEGLEEDESGLEGGEADGGEHGGKIMRNAE